MAKESNNGKGRSPFLPPKGSVEINPLRRNYRYKALADRMGIYLEE